MTATVSLEREQGGVDIDGTDRPGPVADRWRRLPWIVLCLCAASFGYGVTTIPSAPVSQYGLLFSASPLFVISIALAGLGFAIAIRRGNMAAAVVATALMIVTQRLPRLVGTDMPMYSWTYKHLGVVDYIQHKQALARGVDIYNSWPGMFATCAWFSDLTGVSPTTIAHWFTPLFHVAFTCLVYVAARVWGFKPITAITATFLVTTLNWVEQDYFSPQATTMLFTAGIIILVGLSRDRPVGIWLLIIIFTAATITHQLTPYWIFLVIGLLVVGRKMKPWWVVFPLGAILLGFLVYNWDEASKYPLFQFDVAKNATTQIFTKGVLGQRITSGAMRTLSGAMWGSTGLVILWKIWKKQPFWALGVLALSPMLILGGQNYGGEAVFRVFLYSLTGCAMVLAPLFVGGLQGSGKKFVATASIVLVASALSAQGYFGSWHANLMPKIQVDTSKAVLAGAELPAYLTPVAPVWPQRSSWNYADYVKFTGSFDDPMIYAVNLIGSHFDTDEDYRKFLSALSWRNDATTYLIITDQMRLYAWYFGILPWDALPNLKARMFADTDHWQPFYDGQGITVFVHRVNFQ
jgi:hypothetical protein